jgi:hypothetical protein
VGETKSEQRGGGEISIKIKFVNEIPLMADEILGVGGLGAGA